jgi:hypothetical protein
MSGQIFQLRKSSVRSRGAEILEAALVLPIVLSLIFGMVEFAYYFHIEHTIEAAAREAARTACVYTNAVNQDGYQATATSRCNTILQGGGVDPAKVSIIYSRVPENCQPGDDIKVTISTTWGQVGIRLFGLVSDARIIKSEIVFRKEG